MTAGGRHPRIERHPEELFVEEAGGLVGQIAGLAFELRNAIQFRLHRFDVVGGDQRGLVQFSLEPFDLARQHVLAVRSSLQGLPAARDRDGHRDREGRAEHEGADPYCVRHCSTIGAGGG